MKKRILVLLLAAVLLFSLLPAVPAAAANVDDYPVLFTNFNTAGVQSHPKYFPDFTVGDKDILVQALTTYHWNEGKGATPGTISIYDWDDNLVGTWPSTGRAGSGVQNVNWDVFPNVVLKAGVKYYIVDSDEYTWSHNGRSGSAGFYELRGKENTNVFRSEEVKLTYRGIRILIDGQEIIPMDVQGNAVMPFIYNGSTYLPVRAVAGALGLGVDWDGATSTVILTTGAPRTGRFGEAIPSYTTFTGRLTWRGIRILIDGTLITPKDVQGNTVDPFIYNGSTYLPVRALANALGFEVTWDGATNTVGILSRNGTQPPSDPGVTVLDGGIGVAGTMKNTTLEQGDLSVSFGGNETGSALLLNDAFGMAGPTDTVGRVYDFAVTEWPRDPVTVSFDAPDPGAGREYLIQLGIPVKNASGAKDVHWVPLQTSWSGGAARAELDLSGIDDYLDSLEFDGAGETAAVLTNNCLEFGKQMSALNPVSTLGVYSSSALYGVYLTCTGSVPLSFGSHFLIHVPGSLLDSSGKDPNKIWPDDIARYAADMETIYSYFAARYDLSPRTSWPMDIYIRSLKSSVAEFAMPALSFGGRFGTAPIQCASMSISQQALLEGGYRRGAAPGYGGNTVKLYAAFAHELFHFVQRCYVSLGATQRWFDESSAAYYDSVFSEALSGTVVLEENYKDTWPEQFTVLPTTWNASQNPFASEVYARMPVICYLMNRDGAFLRKAYEYLKKTGGFNSWETVLKAASGLNMDELTRGYFRALTSGSLYSRNGEPWTLFDEFRDKMESGGGTDYGQQWYALCQAGFARTLKPTDVTAPVRGSCQLHPYGATFVLLDLTEVPANYTSFDLRLTTPGVSAVLFEISGQSDMDVVDIPLDPQSSLSGVSISGQHYLLMLVNERNTNYAGEHFELTFRLKTPEKIEEQKIPMLCRTYSGIVTYYLDGVFHMENATAEVSVSAYGPSRITLKVPATGLTRSYGASYDQTTGLIGPHCAIFPAGELVTDHGTNPFAQGGASLVIHDKLEGKWNPELLVFNGAFEDGVVIEDPPDGDE